MASISKPRSKELDYSDQIPHQPRVTTFTIALDLAIPIKKALVLGLGAPSKAVQPPSLISDTFLCSSYKADGTKYIPFCFVSSSPY